MSGGWRPEVEGQRTDWATCKGCGRPILWAQTEKGPVPLDPRAPVYVVSDGKAVLQKTTAEAALGMHAYVSHFATCSSANQFGKGKKPVEA